MVTEQQGNRVTREQGNRVTSYQGKSQKNKVTRYNTVTR